MTRIAAVQRDSILMRAADRVMPAHPALLEYAHHFAKAHLLDQHGRLTGDYDNSITGRFCQPRQGRAVRW